MNDSSQEFVLVNGRWVKRPYSNKIKKPPKKKATNRVLSKDERRRLKKERVVNSKATNKGRQNSTPSSSEEKIARFLAANNIKFIREYHTPNLYNPDTNRLLYFDFFIPKYNLVIEFDGIHHFKNVYGGNRLLKQKKVDAIKYGYCMKHKINLLQIRYFDKEDIETIICRKFDEIEPIKTN